MRCEHPYIPTERKCQCYQLSNFFHLFYVRAEFVSPISEITRRGIKHDTISRLGVHR